MVGEFWDNDDNHVTNLRNNCLTLKTVVVAHAVGAVVARSTSWNDLFRSWHGDTAWVLEEKFSNWKKIPEALIPL